MSDTIGHCILCVLVGYTLYGLYDHKRAIRVLVERIKILEHRDR